MSFWVPSYDGVEYLQTRLVSLPPCPLLCGFLHLCPQSFFLSFHLAFAQFFRNFAEESSSGPSRGHVSLSPTHERVGTGPREAARRPLLTTHLKVKLSPAPAISNLRQGPSRSIRHEAMWLPRPLVPPRGRGWSRGSFWGRSNRAW